MRRRGLERRFTKASRAAVRYHFRSALSAVRGGYQMDLTLAQIDTSVIDELVVLKHDREVLADRLQRMLEEKDKVSTPVFQRVEGDYRSRLAALEKGAAPKKDQARREYAKLRTLL